MKLRLLTLSLIALIIPGIAQNPPAQPAAPPSNPRVSGTPSATPFWDCTVPGGNFVVALNKISSVSIHEFTLTGGRVTEVNIDTDGSVCARFYFMEPLKVGGVLSATEAAKEQAAKIAETIADKTGTEKVWRKVHKDYPVATHAHTVEYRLQSKDDLTAIFNSAKTSWTRGEGRIIRVTEQAE